MTKTIDEIKDIDIVSFLEQNGYDSVKHNANKVWFCSPFRTESNPSFVVFTDSNRWIDYGEGMQNHTIIDLVQKMQNCDTKQAMAILANNYNIEKFTPTETAKESPLKVVSVQDNYTDNRLIDYLSSRNIPPHLYSTYTKQVDYCFDSDNAKTYSAVGFRNNKGGFELRNEWHKYATAPKDVTTYWEGYEKINIIEGFFSFMSLLLLYGVQKLNGTTVVLNGLGMLYKVIPKIGAFSEVNIYLDNDK